ncbi:MAG: hypothetical protein ACHQQR_12600, partial [Gemmatimonadales bacterium]
LIITARVGVVVGRVFPLEHGFSRRTANWIARPDQTKRLLGGTAPAPAWLSFPKIFAAVVVFG